MLTSDTIEYLQALLMQQREVLTSNLNNPDTHHLDKIDCDIELLSNIEAEQELKSLSEK